MSFKELLNELIEAPPVSVHDLRVKAGITDRTIGLEDEPSADAGKIVYVNDDKKEDKPC